MQTNITCQLVQSQFRLRSDPICAVLPLDFHSLILASFTSLRRYLHSRKIRLQMENLKSVVF